MFGRQLPLDVERSILSNLYEDEIYSARATSKDWGKHKLWCTNDWFIEQAMFRPLTTSEVTDAVVERREICFMLIEKERRL